MDANGTVYPCPNHVGPRFACGTRREKDLAHVVRDSRVFQEMGRRYRIDRYTRCVRCAFRRWCAGDCRGETLAVTDDPFAPSPHCDESAALIPEVMWLIAAGDARFPRPTGPKSSFQT